MGRFWRPKGPEAQRASRALKGGHGHTRTLRQGRLVTLHGALTRALRRGPHSPILIQKNSVVCTENSVLIDYVNKSPNVTGDDRSVMLLPDPCVYQKPDPNWMARNRICILLAT